MQRHISHLDIGNAQALAVAVAHGNSLSFNLYLCRATNPPQINKLLLQCFTSGMKGHISQLDIGNAQAFAVAVAHGRFR